MDTFAPLHGPALDCLATFAASPRSRPGRHPPPGWLRFAVFSLLAPSRTSRQPLRRHVALAAFRCLAVLRARHALGHRFTDDYRLTPDLAFEHALPFAFACLARYRGHLFRPCAAFPGCTVPSTPTTVDANLPSLLNTTLRFSPPQPVAFCVRCAQ